MERMERNHHIFLESHYVKKRLPKELIRAIQNIECLLTLIYAKYNIEEVTSKVLRKYIIVRATTTPDSASEKIVVMGRGS